MPPNRPRIAFVTCDAVRQLTPSRHDCDKDGQRLRTALGESDLLVQPLVEEVLSRGEWSLVYFDGTFSHAVLKRAREGDFRGRLMELELIEPELFLHLQHGGVARFCEALENLA